MNRSVIVVDYGSGNLLSIVRALENCGGTAVLTHDPGLVSSASHLVIPGVGAFGECMAKFHARELVEPVTRAIAAGAVTLGICVGMQILFEESEEFGSTPGLGLIPGRVTKIPSEGADGERVKVPNVGWRRLLEPVSGAWEGTLLGNVPKGSHCYFVHSFMGVPNRDENRLADVLYGGRKICAAVRSGNLFGTQFHPEKSGQVGLSIFKTYLNM